MSEELITITGIEETCRMLEQAPKEAVPAALLKGLSRSGLVIWNAIASRTPVKKGELLADLAVQVTLDANFRGGSVDVGFSSAQGYVARFVETGHRMIGHKPDKKDLGTVEPHPFMRPAADACAETAVEAFTDGVMESLAAQQIVDAA